MTDLQKFLIQKLEPAVTRVREYPTREKNRVEGFLLETNCAVSNETLTGVFAEWYPGAKTFLQNGDGDNHSVMITSGAPAFLILIANRSKPGGAFYFGEDHEHGGISIEVMQYPNKVLTEDAD